MSFTAKMFDEREFSDRLNTEILRYASEKSTLIVAQLQSTTDKE
jgi:hypothetical protein